jgi:3'-phosphoadenosine 5'-phosphosulfate sulfotransferase (PAPS reductase)/FAD synthetase
MKHTDLDLAQMQSLPLKYKILMTKQRIKQWYEEYNGQVYVSFYGGKDSTVLKHIVDTMYSDVPSVFINTGLEYPEIQKFAKAQKNVITLTPAMRFDEVIKKYGYPVISKETSLAIYSARQSKKNGTPLNYKAKQLYGLITRPDGGKSMFDKSKYQYLVDAPFNSANQCCNVMKKAPAKKYEKETGRKPMVATLAVESNSRRTAWKKNGCNAFNAKRPMSTPLAFWTEQDILHYIKIYNVPYCSVYGDIQIKKDDNQLDGQITIQDYLNDWEGGDILETTKCDRTGCMFCMFGCHLEQSPNRFERLKETHPRQYDYCINGGEEVNGNWQPNKKGLGLGKVLDYIGVKY